MNKLFGIVYLIAAIKKAHIDLTARGIAAGKRGEQP